MGPQPPVGIHRYVFSVFRQKEAMEKAKEVVAEEARYNFNTRQFASKNELGLPIAAVYFNSQREPNKKPR